MSGIVFHATTDRDRICAFYRGRLGFETWLEQDGCTILRYDNLLLGFCERDEAETDGVVTLVYEECAAVDGMHEALSDVAHGEPEENEQYRIYQFFAEDPEGRTLEFQTFLHETPGVPGDE
jgi:catechol 2,3-dioxygenase-like lactoylglutathione lyase family enzyme